jgi:hypothetical protein
LRYDGALNAARMRSLTNCFHALPDWRINPEISCSSYKKTNEHANNIFTYYEAAALGRRDQLLSNVTRPKLKSKERKKGFKLSRMSRSE